MSKERSEIENLSRKLYRENKQRLTFLSRPASGSAFYLAVSRLFGDNPKRDKPIRIGNRNFVYFGFTKRFPSFLPVSWLENLQDGRWPGCENWWAGYPLITWMELHLGDDGITGHLKLNAEVGPLADQEVRRGIIQAIKTEASANQLERIQFEAGALERGRLYSRFFSINSVEVFNVGDANEIEMGLVKLIVDFQREFEVAASAISQFR